MKSLMLTKRALLASAGAGVIVTASTRGASKSRASLRSQQRDLSSGWQFRQTGQANWGEATVPGTVHTDLLRNGRIPEPFYRTNERELQWIDKRDWEYRKTLIIDAETFRHQHLELCFEGLDTYADVFLNDVILLRANNMFREWSIDIKHVARVGANSLRVYFHSPIRQGLAELHAFGLPLPATNDQSENGGLGEKKVSPFTRKAGYHYGWDWGPRFVTSGIWRPVRLRAWSAAKLADFHIRQVSLTRDLARLSATLEVNSDLAGEAVVEVDCLTDPNIKAVTKIVLKPGVNTVAVPLEIKNPKLWWTNGLGEAFLYRFTARVVTPSGIADERHATVGLRTLELTQTPDPDGASFAFKLNGVPVFMKGANWIPNDSFQPRVSRQKYEHLINSAVQSNMNMIRVWGGGIYEENYFYDLCDRAGILVWQDFMFACAMYPGDKLFIENVRQEAAQNIRRLRNHPCIALWCGNNEIDSAWQWDVRDGGWGWKKSYTPAQQVQLTRAYNRIFHEVLRDEVARYDADRPYWPSTPLAAWDGRNAVHADRKAAKQAGDVHFWGVWWGQEPFDDFRTSIGRFMSEYGFQSFPEFKTVQAYTQPRDYDIFSNVMKAHQRSSIGNQTIKTYMERDYNVPSDFRDFLYLSQVLQAEGMKIAMEAHRVRKPYCMGSLFWQINDCWPVASWSSIDYYGRWKAQQYFARDAFAPLLISLVRNGNRVTAHAASDQLNDMRVTLILKVLDFHGRLLSEQKIAAALPANSSVSIFDGNMAKLLNGAAPESVLLFAQLVEYETVLADNILYFAPVKDLALPRPEVKTTVKRGANGELLLTLTSPTLVKNLCLATETADGSFSDNYFDLLPRQQRVVKFKPSTPISPRALKRDLQIKHIVGLSAERSSPAR